MRHIPAAILALGTAAVLALALPLAATAQPAYPSRPIRMIVPLAAHGRTMGAVTFVAAESGRRYTAAEAERLADLFGETSRWADTLKPMQFATVSAMVMAWAIWSAVASATGSAVASAAVWVAGSEPAARSR